MIHSSEKIKVGSRESPLALAQVKEIFSLLGGALPYELATFATRGDKDKATSLTAVEVPDDFFTDALDAAVLDKTIDAAVHSAKDLPRDLPDGLEVFALTAALDETDAFVSRAKLGALPAGARVGTSSLLRKEALLAINPGVSVVDVRGNIGERLKLVEDGKLDGVIVAACALKRLGLAHVIKEILPWETTALQGQLAVVGRRGDASLQKIFAAIDVRKTYGRVVLVGAGPGDPDLITVKGIKALKKSDCVFYDYLADKELLNYAPRAEKIYAGRRKGAHTISQSELCRMMRQKVVTGKNVARLKGGDPLIFGRGADEIEYFRSYHIDIEIIPGISSATGILSGMGVPLTARGVSSSVAFVSGHEESEKEPQPVKIPKADTIVFFMGLTKLGAILQSLRADKWDEKTPVMIISKGTRADERILTSTIADIEQAASQEQLEPPALIVVGQTIKFWKETSNANTLYLGTNPQKYRVLGHVIHWPMIDIKPAAIPSRILLELNDYDTVLFTSRYAVKYFLDWLMMEKFDLRKLAGKELAAIGEDTALCLRTYDLEPSIVADEETSEGFLVKLEKLSLKNRRVLFPRSSLPNPFLKTELEKRGAKVIELTVYENTAVDKKDLPAAAIDQVVFTSPSTVKNFLNNYGSIPQSWRILSKGPRTQQALREAGYESEVVVIE